MLGISTTNLRVNGFRGGIDADAKAIYNRIIADSGVSNLSRLNYLVKGLKTIYGSLSNTPVCYDAHWIGYQPANGVGATSGQACSKLYSLTVAGDAVQATASAQPLLLAHNGASTDNYWYGSGVAGNYVSTPNAVANQITGDIEIIAYKVKFDFTGLYAFTSKADGVANKNYLFCSEGGFLNLYQSFDGSNLVSAQASVSLQSLGYSANTDIWLKVTRNSVNGNILYYASSNGITFNQVGGIVTSTTGNRFNSTNIITIGSWGNYAYFLNGKISRVTIANTIGGTPVVDFNPASYNAATSQTQWTSATSEVWTINQSTGQTLHGCLVDRTLTQGAGTTYSLAVASLAATQPYTEYVMANRIGTGNFISRATGNIRGHDATNYSLNNGTLLTLANTSRNRQLLTYRNNGASSGIAVNNGTETTGNSGTNNGTNLTILEGAHIINTIIQTNTEDTAPQRLAMFNFIKTLNNL